MEEGKGERYLASGRQYGNALLGVRHQEEEEVCKLCIHCTVGGHKLIGRYRPNRFLFHSHHHHHHLGFDPTGSISPFDHPICFP